MVFTTVVSSAAAEELPAPYHAPRDIEEVVVTARKREERSQEVPVAVTAIGEGEIERYNLSDLTRVAEMTPQLFVSEAPIGNGGSLAIRGIGASYLNAGAEQAVSIYVDGIQYDRGNVLAQGYLDLARVEVMKGPQALFFGKNNTAGVVSLVSADPGPERELIGRAGHEFNADESWFEAIGSTPLGDRLGVRIALRYGLFNGFMHNTAGPSIDPGSLTAVPAPSHRYFPDKDELLGRFTIAYQPTRDIDVKLKVGGDTLRADGVTQSAEIFYCPAFGHAMFDLAEDCKADRKIRQNDLAPEIARSESLFDEEKGQLYNRYHSYNAVLSANWNLGKAVLSSVTGYAHYTNRYLGDYDFTGTPLSYAAQDVENDAYSQELRLLTQLDFPLNAMVGGYWQKTDFGFHDIARALPMPVDPTTGRYVTWARHSATDGQTLSPFAQLTWKALETVELSPGVRYSHVTKDSFSVHDYLHPLSAALFRPVGSRLADDFSDDDVSPEVTASWHPNVGAGSQLNLYAAYKEGFKSGGFSNGIFLRSDTTRESAVFPSERVSGFEGGIKSTWLEKTLRFNVVGYRYHFDDLQVTFFDASAFNFITQTAKGANTTGTEAELEWIPPITGLELHGTLSYNLARYDRFLSYCFAGQSAAEGCNLGPDGRPALLGTRQDLSGTPPPLAPRWTAGVGFLYDHSVAFGWSVELGADTGYSDHYLLNPLGRRLFQDHYFRTDATLRVFQDRGPLAISLFGRNLSNEYVVPLASADVPFTGLVGTGLPVSPVPSDEVAVAGRPREIGIEMTARF